METNHIQQVAWYVAQLRHDDQVDLYSQFLSTLSHEADKRLSLSLAVENSLPIHEILTQVVQRIHDLETEESADEITEMQLISRKIKIFHFKLKFYLRKNFHGQYVSLVLCELSYYWKLRWEHHRLFQQPEIKDLKIFHQFSGP